MRLQFALFTVVSMLSVVGVAFSADEPDAPIASNQRADLGDKWVNKIFELKDSAASLSLKRLEQVADEAVFLADNVTLLVRSNAGGLTLWDTTSGRAIRDLPDVPLEVVGFAVTPDRRFAAAMGAGGGVVVWDLTTTQVVQAFNWELLKRRADLVFSPDGKLLSIRGRYGAFGSNGVWDVQTGKRIWSINTAPQAAEGRPIPFDWDLALKLAAIGRDDMSIDVVDLATGKTRHTLRGHRRSVRYSSCRSRQQIRCLRSGG